MLKRDLIEKDVEKECVDYFLNAYSHLGARNYKIDKLRKADPDQLFVTSTIPPFYVEFKRPGKKPRPLQYVAIEELRCAGYRVEVVTSFTQFQAMLKKFLGQY